MEFDTDFDEPDATLPLVDTEPPTAEGVTFVMVVEYDIASLCLVSFYCFVTKAFAKKPGAAASVERRRREGRTLLAGVACELAGATRLAASQVFERMHNLY